MRNWGPWPRNCWYQYTEQCPDAGEHLRIACCFLGLIRYLGVWVTPESTRPVGEETKEVEGRAQGSLLLQPSLPGFYLREAKTSQKLPHCVQDSPAPRRQRVTQQRILEPMAASGTQDCCWLGRGSLAVWCKVLTLLLP